MADTTAELRSHLVINEDDRDLSWIERGTKHREALDAWKRAMHDQYTPYLSDADFETLYDLAFGTSFDDDDSYLAVEATVRDIAVLLNRQRATAPHAPVEGLGFV